MAFTNPQKLQAAFEQVQNVFDRLTPFEKIPSATRNSIMDLFNKWSGVYENAKWGSTATASSPKWTQVEQDTWNKALKQVATLVNKAAKTPGVTVTVIQLPTETVKAVTVADETVKAPVPWYFLIGSVAFVGLVAAIFSKKERGLSSFRGSHAEHKITLKNLISNANRILDIAHNSEGLMRKQYLRRADQTLARIFQEQSWIDPGKESEAIKDIENRYQVEILTG